MFPVSTLPPQGAFMSNIQNYDDVAARLFHLWTDLLLASCSTAADAMRWPMPPPPSTAMGPVTTGEDGCATMIAAPQFTGENAVEAATEDTGRDRLDSLGWDPAAADASIRAVALDVADAGIGLPLDAG